MSLSKKSPTITIPQYSPPPKPSFSAFGQTAGPQGSGYSLTEDPTQLADRQAAEQVRRELIGSLGLNGSDNDPYAQKLLSENLRIAQPQLENSLIQRGLGGSSVYQGALTDLFSKASMDAILNSQNSKLNTLAGLQSSYLGPYEQLGQNLLQLAASTGISQEQLAQAMYQATLPYKTTVDYPKQSGLLGGIQGFLSDPGGIAGLGQMAGGILSMNPALIGSGLMSLLPSAGGAATGYFGSQANAYSQPYMLSDYYKQNSGLSLQNLLGLAQGGRAF